MTLASRHLMRIAATLALTAACTSAFAQSAEYRRGYEDGYAAGQRAARGGDRDRDRDRDRGDYPGFRIDRADYGARGAFCDARRAVRQDAERNGGVILAGNHLCGDPIPNVQKQLNVLYRCADGEQMRASAREGDSVRLHCRR